MKAQLLHSKDINNEAWDALVANSPQGSIFMESGYLKVILQGEWSGIAVYNDQELVAIMPLAIRQKLGISYALQPIMAKYWGIAFHSTVFPNHYKEFSFKKKVVDAFIACIPPNIAHFNNNFHPSFDYPLPFYWKSFNLRSQYTNILDVRSKPEKEILDQYAPDLRAGIRTAEKLGVKIIEDHSSGALIKVLNNNSKAGKTIFEERYYAILDGVLKYATAAQKGFSLTAINNNNEAIASSIYMKDKGKIYALIHTVDKSASKSDALSLLVHHAVLRAANENLLFDFLGSMMEPIEAFNRRFGAVPVPYLNISKKSRLLSLVGK